jgi:hypothetical protein
MSTMSQRGIVQVKTSSAVVAELRRSGVLA